MKRVQLPTERRPHDTDRVVGGGDVLVVDRDDEADALEVVMRAHLEFEQRQLQL